MLNASPSSHDYVDLQMSHLSIIPSPVINKGAEIFPSSFVPLPTQVKFPHKCPLNSEVGHNSKPKADTNHLSLDILMPSQMASTQAEMAAYQMTDKEDA